MGSFQKRVADQILSKGALPLEKISEETVENLPSRKAFFEPLVKKQDEKESTYHRRDKGKSPALLQGGSRTEKTAQKGERNRAKRKEGALN